MLHKIIALIHFSTRFFGQQNHPVLSKCLQIPLWSMRFLFFFFFKYTEMRSKDNNKTRSLMCPFLKDLNNMWQAPSSASG